MLGGYAPLRRSQKVIFPMMAPRSQNLATFSLVPPAVANYTIVISVGVTDPRILCEPFVVRAAEWTVCTAEKYWFAEERFAVHLDASG